MLQMVTSTIVIPDSSCLHSVHVKVRLKRFLKSLSCSLLVLVFLADGMLYFVN
jgi:hypothetical protein